MRLPEMELHHKATREERRPLRHSGSADRLESGAGPLPLGLIGWFGSYAASSDGRVFSREFRLKL